MNTKLIMTASCALLGISGVFLIFAPDLFLEAVKLTPDVVTRLLVQMLGALYFAFCMLNWMVKESLIGGIYNRPVAIGNFTHFMIAGLSLVKVVLSGAEIPLALLIATIVYVILGIAFGLILFKSPVKVTESPGSLS